jgi:hypothetical protein
MVSISTVMFVNHAPMVIMFWFHKAFKVVIVILVFTSWAEYVVNVSLVLRHMIQAPKVVCV